MDEMSGIGGTMRGTTGELMSRRIRAGRRGISLRDESGQIMVFFVLILFTLLSFSALVINVGQVLDRKALAQRLADVGALAGASEQASSLNKVTDLNADSFELLRYTGYVTRVVPFDLRIESQFGQDLEARIRNGLDLVSLVFASQLAAAYAELAAAPGNANTRAADVTAANAATLFPGEAVTYSNPDPDPQTYMGATVLYTPSDPFSGKVYWGYFTSDCPITPFTPAPICNTNVFSWLFDYCATYYSYLGGDLDDYTFDETYFIRDDQSDEIHFYWRVSIPATGAILGVFPTIPEITAVSKAKPYGGYSGQAPSKEDIEDIWAYSALPACTCPFGQINNVWDDIEIYKVDRVFDPTFAAKLDAIYGDQDQELIDWLNANYSPLSEVIH